MIWDPERSGAAAARYDPLLAPGARLSRRDPGDPGVNPLQLTAPAGRPLSVLAIGAHPDDIEIGAGGTLLSLAGAPRRLRARYVVLTGTAERQLEARAAAQAFLPGAELAVDLHRPARGSAARGLGRGQGRPRARGRAPGRRT